MAGELSLAVGEARLRGVVTAPTRVSEMRRTRHALALAQLAQTHRSQPTPFRVGSASHVEPGCAKDPGSRRAG